MSCLYFQDLEGAFADGSFGRMEDAARSTLSKCCALVECISGRFLLENDVILSEIVEIILFTLFEFLNG